MWQLALAFHRGRFRVAKASAADKRYFKKVVELCCIACRQIGYDDSPAEIHHCRFNGGTGLKGSNREVIPLCAQHHRLGGHGIAIHSGQVAFEKKYGREENLLKETLELLNV